jgi:hypothetical protein
LGWCFKQILNNFLAGEYLNIIFYTYRRRSDIMKAKNITDNERETLRYQLLKLEYLTKKKAGQYVLLDAENKRIVASGEQTRLDKTAKNELLEKANPREVIAFLKSLNNYLEKTENLSAKRSVLTLFE